MAETNFFHDVYDVVRLIPKGRVTSYGAIAKYLGSAKSSRMVGWALNGSHSVLPPIPAHRVVNKLGLLTGKHHFETYTTMCELLKSEGVEIKNDSVANFDQIFWDPAIELTIKTSPLLKKNHGQP